ncbi:MAG TPA: HAMP domain-containing sensor histidine kinase, partial [Gemmatimonadaceae bacterium]
RATAERALNDYAAIAAWDLVAGVNDELQSTLGPALAPMTRARAMSPYELLPAPGMLAASADGAFRCPMAENDSGRFYFRIDFRDGSLATDGAAPSAAMRRWLTDTIASHGRSIYQPDWTYAVIVGGPKGESQSAIAYAVKYAEHRAPIAAYGIRTCVDFLGGSTISSVMARRALLPTSVTGGAPNDSIVTITVHDPEGTTVYESQHTPVSPYAAQAVMEQAGGLTVRAAIRPHALELLAFGSIPQSRVPLLTVLLTLTAGMVIITVLQLRREHELSRLRSDFISSVSHELRTPLAQILLFAETLNLGRIRTEEERHGATDVIVQEGRRLMHLVENILHFSRAERQMTRLGPEPLDLSEAVQEIVNDWAPLASNAGITIRTEFAADVHAIADRSALRQMILNLLDNAMKYGPPTQTVIVSTARQGERARVWVDDEGSGIPLRERERVFASFYRLEQHANSSVAGSGIGLYVVRELARLHRGRAWVEDAPSGGARVIIELPTAPHAHGFTGEHMSVSSIVAKRGTTEKTESTV